MKTAIKRQTYLSCMFMVRNIAWPLQIRFIIIYYAQSNLYKKECNMNVISNTMNLR